VRFLSFYTVALTGIYTVISYKTPWCALNFWLGTILLAGVGAAVLVESFRDKLTRMG
jgi:putative Mn2+ efflux pump MntP